MKFLLFLFVLCLLMVLYLFSSIQYDHKKQNIPLVLNPPPPKEDLQTIIDRLSKQ